MTDTREELEAHLAAVIAEIESLGGKIVVKNGWFWKALHWIVYAITFGKNKTFIDGYYTTLAHIVGVPLDWEERSIVGRIAVLEHESKHIRQCKKVGLGSVWIGFPLYTVLYLLLPLPVGFAYFRWRFEREAYAHGINIELSYSGKNFPWRRKYLIDSAVEQMSTGAYGWTWILRKNVRRYFDKNVRSE